ncbi:hypothetical protein ACJMK2_020934 [Sinanodonta woodiana]|uniref:Uncharacterized protein n=1 Tax=Sinanodonta woodiana TaxID=1069815 RepID=A0ABD3U0K4_SINWO
MTALRFSTSVTAQELTPTHQPSYSPPVIIQELTPHDSPQIFHLGHSTGADTFTTALRLSTCQSTGADTFMTALRFSTCHNTEADTYMTALRFSTSVRAQELTPT